MLDSSCMGVHICTPTYPCPRRPPTPTTPSTTPDLSKPTLPLPPTPTHPPSHPLATTPRLEHIIKETSSAGGGGDGPHLAGDAANPEGLYFTAHKWV